MTMNQFRTARLEKDKNYDGIFYVGVKTTGIFCRPSCPASSAKEENVIYYNKMVDALDHGFRPCLRCKPDIHTDYQQLDGAELVEKALSLIYDGYLNDHTIKDLASHLFTSTRNLRAAFSTQLAMPPVKIAKYHKAIFAKRLVLNSDLRMTDIAFASGFKSIRQFNDVFKDIFKMAPSKIRKEEKLITNADNGIIRIPYKEDFDFTSVISFMKPRALTGVELIDDLSYSRTFRIDNALGYFVVKDNPKNSCLELQVHSEDIRTLMPIYNRVKKMFDIDTDLNSIYQRLSSDNLLLKGMNDGLPPRLPVAYNAFEFVIRAILGQVVSVSFATTLAERLVNRSNISTPDEYPVGLDYYFPRPEELKEVDLSDMGMTKTKINTIALVIEALLNDQLSLSKAQLIEDFHKDFIKIKGIGDWTVQYVAMRGLGIKDAFPYNDLGVIKALSIDGDKPTNKEIRERASQWKPFRAYATLCLWASLGSKEDK